MAVAAYSTAPAPVREAKIINLRAEAIRRGRLKVLDTPEAIQAAWLRARRLLQS